MHIVTQRLSRVASMGLCTAIWVLLFCLGTSLASPAARDQAGTRLKQRQDQEDIRSSSSVGISTSYTANASTLGLPLDPDHPLGIQLRLFRRVPGSFQARFVVFTYTSVLADLWKMETDYPVTTARRSTDDRFRLITVEQSPSTGPQSPQSTTLTTRILTSAMAIVIAASFERNELEARDWYVFDWYIMSQRRTQGTVRTTLSEPATTALDPAEQNRTKSEITPPISSISEVARRDKQTLGFVRCRHQIHWLGGRVPIRTSLFLLHRALVQNMRNNPYGFVAEGARAGIIINPSELAPMARPFTFQIHIPDTHTMGVSLRWDTLLEALRTLMGEVVAENRWETFEAQMMVGIGPGRCASIGTMKLIPSIQLQANQSSESFITL